MFAHTLVLLPQGLQGGDPRGRTSAQGPSVPPPWLLPLPSCWAVHLGSWGHGGRGKKRPQRQDPSKAEGRTAGVRCGRGWHADTGWCPPPERGLRCGQLGLARGVLSDPRPGWSWGVHSPEMKDAFVRFFFFSNKGFILEYLYIYRKGAGRTELELCTPSPGFAHVKLPAPHSTHAPEGPHCCCASHGTPSFSTLHPFPH